MNAAERRDQHAVRAREDAVHHARLRSVEGGGEPAVRVEEAQEDPVGEDGIEQVLGQEHRGEVVGRVRLDRRVEIVESGAGQRDEPAAAADHVGDPNPAFGIAPHELSDLIGAGHSRGKCLPAIFLRKADEVFQEQRLDPCPDETPDDVEEQDSTENLSDLGEVHPVLWKKAVLRPVTSVASQNSVRAALNRRTAKDAVSGKAPVDESRRQVAGRFSD